MQRQKTKQIRTRTTLLTIHYTCNIVGRCIMVFRYTILYYTVLYDIRKLFSKYLYYLFASLGTHSFYTRMMLHGILSSPKLTILLLFWYTLINIATHPRTEYVVHVYKYTYIVVIIDILICKFVTYQPDIFFLICYPSTR